MQQDLPIIIDIEASGFGRGSYPIEIGLILEDGATHCRLLKPHESWNHWSEDAQKVHQIERSCLFTAGYDLKESADWLNSILYGKTVYSDAWSQDMSWLGKLFDITDTDQKFRMEALNVLLNSEQMERWNDLRDSVEQDLNLTRHRASNDAKIIQLAYKTLIGI